jgi:hypothetical protein
MTNARIPNSLKCRALAAFDSCGSLNPPTWAIVAGMTPARSAYTYLLRLHRFGLLERNRDARGLLVYSLSARGRQRLAWLRRVQSPEVN